MSNSLIFIVFVYAIFLAGIGYFARRRNEGWDDYFSGTGFKGWIVGLSFGATYASANMFLGVPALAYQYGTAALWWTMLGSVMPFIALILFAGKIWRQGGEVLTPSEWIEDRFESRTLGAVSSLAFFFLVFYAAGQIIGVSLILENLTGISYSHLVILTVVFVSVYTILGGLDATILTDLFQSLLMMFVAVAVFLSGYFTFDGIDFMSRSVSSISNIQGMTGWLNAESMMFADLAGLSSVTWLMFSFIFLPHLLNRIYTLEDFKQLKGFLYGSGISLFTLSVFMVWAGIYGRSLLGELQNPDLVVPLYVTEAFPPLAANIVLVGILTAAFTTSDSIIHAISTNFTHEVEKLSERSFISGKLLHLSGIVFTAMLVLIISLIRPENILNLTQIGITGVLSGLGVLIVLSFAGCELKGRDATKTFLVGIATFTITYTFVYDNFYKLFLLSSLFSTLTALILYKT